MVTTNLSPFRSKVLERARFYIGVKEATGKNDGDPARLFNHGEEKPWCAAFVAEVFAEAGCALPGKAWLLPSVDYMEDQLLKNGRWFDKMWWEKLQPADIILFDYRVHSDSGRGRHVGIVTSVANRRIYTIEGNSRNMVAERDYPVPSAASTSPISGYAKAEQESAA